MEGSILGGNSGDQPDLCHFSEKGYLYFQPLVVLVDSGEKIKVCSVV